MNNDFLDDWTEKKNSIVVFAGVFDPVHNGHLSAAHAALHYGSEVVFLAERIPQHKHGTTAYQHRLNMLSIATEDTPEFTVLDYPRDNQWVRETFEWLTMQYPGKSFVWLVGNDVAPLIASWPDSDKLAELNVSKIAVIKRQGLDELRVEKIHDVPVIHRVRPMSKDEDISSTLIRNDIGNTKDRVPVGVYSYIQEHNLYSLDSESK